MPVTNRPWKSAAFQQGCIAARMPRGVRPRATRRAGLLCAAVGGLVSGATGVSAQNWSTVTASRQLAGEDEVRVHVEYGAGVLDLRPGEPGTLYRMELRYDQDVVEPETRYDNGRLEIGMDRIGRGVRFGSRDGSGRLDLELTRDVPLLLDLEFGAVRADLELGGLAIRDLDVETGASDTRIEISQPNPAELELASFEAGAANFVATGLGNLNAERIRLEAKAGKATLDFTGEWQRSADVSVELDLGAVELRFPRGLGVRLVPDVLLTSVDAQEMLKRGSDYFSQDWDSAEMRVTVEIDASIGAIDVVWVP